MSLFGRTAFGLVNVATLYTAANTVIALTTGDGARLPTPSTDGTFPLAWWDATTYPEGPDADPSREVVWVGSRSGDTLVVSRGAESAFGGGAASTKNSSGATYKMLLGWTPATITQVEDRLVDEIRVPSATMGFYASGSNEITATVASGNNVWTATQTTFVVNHPLVGVVASGPPQVGGLYRTTQPIALGVLKGTATVSILAGFNVGSFVRNSTGEYTLYFTQPAPTNLYTVTIGGEVAVSFRVTSGTATTSRVNFQLYDGAGGATDDHRVSVVVQGLF